MKIGILTFHFVHNYGAVLQAYALQEFLLSRNLDVEFVDYRPYKCLYHEFRRFYIGRFVSRHIKYVLQQILLIPKRELRWKNFERFIDDNLILSKRVDKVSDDYDIYIVGSDQIWNYQITHGFQNNYFALFPFPKGNRKYISYAPSLGQTSLSSVESEYIEKALANIDAISVRELSMIDLLGGLTKKPLVQVVDPTLLVQREVWLKKKDVASPHLNKYVLVYEVVSSPRTLEVANHIANKNDAEVLVIKPHAMITLKKNVMTTTSPDAFLNYIAHACYVVTTSFHGTVFSLIYNVPFFTIRHNNSRDARSLSLLATIGLEDRMIDGSNLPECAPIDYTTVNKRIDILRAKSQTWLINSIDSKQTTKE